MKPLWDHQKKCIDLASPPEIKNFAFLLDPGLGKSRVTIEVLKAKFAQHGKILRTLIFAPPVVVDNWRQEWLKFTDFDKNVICPLTGSGVKRLKTFSQSEAKIFILNYESLLMKDLFEALKKWSAEAIISDESHMCKSITSNRSKLLYELSDPIFYKRGVSAPLRYILTGTAVLNSPMDLFQQFKILDSGETFGLNPWTFRAKYFVDRNSRMPSHMKFPKWEIKELKRDGFDGKAEINKKIYTKSFRAKKDECMDLPPEVFVEIGVDMSAEQSRLYNEMKRDFITYYNSKACVAPLAITKLGRLLELTSGFITTEGIDGSPRVKQRLKDNPKLDALAGLLEQITEDQKSKVIIWSIYIETYSMIREVCEKLKLGYAEVHGEVNESTKQLNIKKFNEDQSCRVFISNPASGGIGINLVAAGYSITFSRSYNLGHHIQSMARNRRGGSKEAGHACITRYDLVVNDTVDLFAIKMLANKEDMSEKVLRQIVEELKK